MEEVILDAEIRAETGKAKVKKLKAAGFLPAVIYGQGKESLVVKVSHKQLLQLIHEHRSENMVINLKVKGDKKPKGRACLIKDIQYDPVKGDIIHLDFNEVSLTKEIKVNVPVVAKGEPVGVKAEGGSLDHILWELEVECLPADIPKEITVDVSNLKIGDTIHIKDISLPPKIKVLNDPEAAVLSVAAPIKEEVAPVAAEAEAPQEPEVIKEKKEAPPEEAPEEKKEKEKEKE